MMGRVNSERKQTMLRISAELKVPWLLHFAACCLISSSSQGAADQVMSSGIARQRGVLPRRVWSVNSASNMLDAEAAPLREQQRSEILILS